MCRKINFLITAILLCGFLFPFPVQAQDDKPLWWHNLDCDKVEQKYAGLQYCKGKSPYEYIHVIVIQLESPGIQVEYLLPSGIDKNGIFGECKDVNRSTKYLGGPGCDDPANRNWYPVMSLKQAVEKAMRSDLALVINGDYSACTISPQVCVDKDGNSTYRLHGPEGLTVVRGVRLDGTINGDGDNNIVTRPYLVISQSAPLIAELHRSGSDKDGLKPYNWTYTGIGGAPWLIQDGKALPNLINCEGADRSSCRNNASQTAVGLTLDKKWMFLVLASDARTLQDVATFMDEKLDVWQAIKFDGGGSSQLYYGGSENPYVEMGDQRLLTNFLAIYAQPGTGIFPDSPSEPSEPLDNPEPSPSDDNLNWWQKIQKGWSDFWNGVGNWWQDRVNWWNGVKKDFTDWLNGVKTWWRELPQRIEDWLLQQFWNWVAQQINQLCGSASLIPAIMAAVICVRKYRSIKTGL